MKENPESLKFDFASTPLHGGGVDKDDSIDLERLLHILFIHKWKFIIILILVWVFCYLYRYHQAEFYKSTFEVYYSESASRYVESTDVQVVNSDFDKNYWLSVMTSNQIAQLTREYSGLPFTQEEIRGKISVELVRDEEWWVSPKYIVTITDENNQFIPIIFQSYIHALNEALLNYQVDFSANLVDYLSGQLSNNYDNLNQIEREIMMEQASNPYQVRDIDRMASDLEYFRKDLQSARVSLASVTASKERTEMELANIDPTIMNQYAYTEPLKVQMMNLQVELARALTQQQEDHPRVKALRENIIQVNHLLQDNIEQTMEIHSLSHNPLQNELTGKLIDFQISEISLKARVTALTEVIMNLENQMLPNADNMGQRQLVRKRELILSTIENLNNRLIDIQSTAHGGLHRFLYIDKPQAPIFPANRSMQFYILIGLVLGTGLGICGVFIFDYLDNRIMLVRDFESLYNLFILGTLPHKKNAQRYFLDTKNNQSSYYHKRESNEMIFFVRQLIKRKSQKLISISSPIRGEGKTLVSMQLAIGLADKKMDVLLVDLDVFTPKLTEAIKAGNILLKPGEQSENTAETGMDDSGHKAETKGLIDYIDNGAKLEEIIQTTRIPALNFITSGTSENIHDMGFDTDKFKSFLIWAGKNYEAVIFDTPALLFLPNLSDLMEQVDIIIPVVRLRYTTRHMFDRVSKMLQPYSEKVAGVILNDVHSDMKLDHYGGYNY